jgi:ATP-binding cassette subfamily C protein
VGPFLTLIVTAFLVKAGISYAVLRLAILTASGIVVRTRRRLLRALLGARWDFFQSQPAGRLGNAIGLESEQIADLYLLACRMAAGLIQVVVYLALAFTISWALSLCALALAGLGFIFFNSLVERGSSGKPAASWMRTSRP